MLKQVGFVKTVGLSITSHKGGILQAWNPGVYVKPLQINQHWIHLLFNFGSQELVYIVNVYGLLKVQDHEKLWDFLVATS